MELSGKFFARHDENSYESYEEKKLIDITVVIEEKIHTY